MVERDINARWEAGTDHHPKSVELFDAIRKIDEQNGGGSDWRSGGDGDNGEQLMYQLDIYFECIEAGEKI